MLVIAGNKESYNTMTASWGVWERPATILHYNPGKWRSYFSAIFAACLILISLTRLFMNKGKWGLIGIGGIEILIGFAIPILFLLFM